MMTIIIFITIIKTLFKKIYILNKQKKYTTSYSYIYIIFPQKIFNSHKLNIVLKKLLFKNVL